jgi:hypothetical protein
MSFDAFGTFSWGSVPDVAQVIAPFPPGKSKRKLFVIPTRRFYEANPIMARPGAIEFKVSQSPNAVENYSVRMDPDLPEGAMVAATGHEIVHTPPSGGSSTIPTISVNGNTVTVSIGPLLVSGLHKVEAVIAYDNAGGIEQGVIFWVTVP